MVPVFILGFCQVAVLLFNKDRAGRAPVGHDRKLGIRGDSLYPEGNGMGEFAVGGDRRIGSILQLGIVQAEPGAAALALQAGQAVVLVAHVYVGDGGFSAPGAEGAHCSHIFFEQGILKGKAGVSLKGAVPDQLFVPQHVEEFRGLAESLVHGGEDDLAVLVKAKVIRILVAAAVGIR